jgi:putative intracellular protease/amidase
VCHGPAGIVNVKLSNGKYLVDGKKVTGFTDSEENAVGLTQVVPFLLEKTLRERGAEFAGVADFKENVVISDRLATGQNPASARKLASAVAQLITR